MKGMIIMAISVTKRGKYWQYRFDTGKIDGVRKQVSKSGFKSKKDAMQAGIKAANEYFNTGIVLKKSTITLSDYLDYWLDTYCKVNLKINTQVGYLYVIENHLKPNLGFYRLIDLRASIIQEYVNALRIRGLARSSVVNIIAVLSGALKYAIEPMQYIQYNPCNYIKFPKFAKRQQVRYFITRENFDKILERFPESTPYYLPFLIGYYTGLRIGEVFALTWDEIDMEKRTLTVNKTLIKRNFGVDVRQVLKMKGKKEEKSAWYFGAPKTDKSERTIYFGDVLYKALRIAKIKQKQNEWTYGEFYTCVYKKPERDEKGEIIYRLLEIEKGVPCALERAKMVCTRETGEFLTPDSMKYPSRVIHHELKLQFNFHSLRHTHTTILYENGADSKDIASRLGHSDVTFTQNTYTFDTEKMQKRTVDIFEKNA